MNKELWDELKKDGFAIVDYPMRKIAVYPNENLSVTIFMEDLGGSAMTTIEHGEVAEFCAALVRAGNQSAADNFVADSEYAAHRAIETARAGVAK